MDTQRGTSPSRREFLQGLTAAGTAAWLGADPAPAVAEPALETTRIKLVEITGICIAPQYVADDLLRAEGFTDVQYFRASAGIERPRPSLPGRRTSLSTSSRLS